MAVVAQDGGAMMVSLCHSTDTAATTLVDEDWVIVGHLPNDPAVPVRRHLEQRGLTATWVDPASGHRLTLSSRGQLSVGDDDPFLDAARAL